jgi:UDP-glucose 4-epimerase
VAAARHLLEGGASDAFNLGTGRGSSVREVLDAAGRAVGRAVPFVMGPRRHGDPAELVADPAKARRVLGWQAGNSDLGTILDTAWAWHRKDRRAA